MAVMYIYKLQKYPYINLYLLLMLQKNTNKFVHAVIYSFAFSLMDQLLSFSR